MEYGGSRVDATSGETGNGNGMGKEKLSLGLLELSSCIWAERSGRRGRNKGSARK